MKIAIIYQAKEPPPINGIRKPMKPGGYSDSSADIACCLKQNNIDVVTPVLNPDVYNDKEWCFPDTDYGIKTALSLGADTLWLNTVLYKGHPIDNFKNIYVIGNSTESVELYDDKYYTNNILRQSGLSVVKEEIVSVETKYTGGFPCVLKPIRGRGSQGVVRCGSRKELEHFIKVETEQKVYGTRLMAEEYLSGREVTLSILPGGESLPFVERINHIGGVAPYNGDVPVTENSFVINDDEPLEKIRRDCEKAADILKLKGLVRIDCRADENGVYKMFDFNLKPNMTGASRPHRLNQNSLTMIAAQACGMTFFDLLLRLIESRRILH